MKNLYRLLVGVLGLVSVAVQYWLVTRGEGGSLYPASSVHFFSFFTILTNLIAAAAMLAPVLAPNSRLGRFLDRPTVRAAIVGYIVIVGSVYWALLSGIDKATGLHLYLEYVLHYVIPPLFVLDWLLFVPKGEIGWRNGVDSLAYPGVYLGWTLVHGYAANWYPYPFIDVTKLGYPRMLLNSLGLVLAFLVIELLLVAIGRLLEPHQRDLSP
jgi:hypothetical protein